MPPRSRRTAGCAVIPKPPRAQAAPAPSRCSPRALMSAFLPSSTTVQHRLGGGLAVAAGRWRGRRRRAVSASSAEDLVVGRDLLHVEGEVQEVGHHACRTGAAAGCATRRRPRGGTRRPRGRSPRGPVAFGHRGERVVHAPEVVHRRAAGGEPGRRGLQDLPRLDEVTQDLVTAALLACASAGCPLSKTFHFSGWRTRVPIFRRISTRPFAASTRMPSRTEVRETPNCSVSSASFGSRSPGA